MYLSVLILGFELDKFETHVAMTMTWTHVGPVTCDFHEGSRRTCLLALTLALQGPIDVMYTCFSKSNGNITS